MLVRPILLNLSLRTQVNFFRHWHWKYCAGPKTFDILVQLEHVASYLRWFRSGSVRLFLCWPGNYPAAGTVAASNLCCICAWFQTEVYYVHHLWHQSIISATGGCWNLFLRSLGVKSVPMKNAITITSLIKLLVVLKCAMSHVVVKWRMYVWQWHMHTMM